MGGRGSSEYPARAHMHRLQRLRQGLTCLAFKGVWWHVQAWVRAKFDQLIPLLVLYLLIKFCDNRSSVQQLATILVFDFKCCLGTCVVEDLNEI